MNESILKRAREKKIISLDVIDIRKFTSDKHHTADDKPYGGGPGMVMKAEPILKAIESIKKSAARPKVVILSAAGKQFSETLVKKYAKGAGHIILIAGHYEGIDERVKKILKAEEVSVGPYVLTGGELPAMVFIDAISRYIPGVLGKYQSLESTRHGVGVPTYTRPEVLLYKEKKYSVPKVLHSGDHKKIDEWRKNNRK